MEKKIKILNITSQLPATVTDRMQCRLMSGVVKLENVIGKEISIQNAFLMELENTEKNEKYTQLVLKCEDDKWYYTCSSSFMQDIEDCFDEVADSEGKFASLVVIPLSIPSKNNSGSFYKTKFIKIRTTEDIE